MPTYAVLADPPVTDAAPSGLARACSTSEDAALRLYEAMLADVCSAVQAGGGDLLVNYRDADALSLSIDSEARLRDLLDAELDSPDAARYEVQVGQTFAGRVGNTVTHLLTEEGAESVVALRPTAAMFARRHVGTMAMKLRSAEAVLCPAPGGSVAAAGFAEPIDFADAYAEPAIETLTDRALDADCSVDFMEPVPTFGSAEAIATALPILRAKAAAGRPVPARTAAVVRDLDLASDA